MPSRILLVEDDKEIAEYAGRGLQEEGFLITIAFTGSEGKKLLSNQQWDLVVLDWWLPSIEGIS